LLFILSFPDDVEKCQNSGIFHTNIKIIITQKAFLSMRTDSVG
jgi:hypothetical protein